MSWALCTSGAAVAKAGTHCNAVSGSAVTMAKWSDEAEGRIEVETHTALISNIASLPTGIQGAISDVCSSYVAMSLITFDPTGYLYREADMLMNLNSDRVNKGLAILKDKTNLKLITP